MFNFSKAHYAAKSKEKFFALGGTTKFLNLWWVMGLGKNKFFNLGRGSKEKKLAGAGRLGFSPRPTALLLRCQ